MIKRTIAVLLCLIMLAGILPAGSFAASSARFTDVEDDALVQETDILGLLGVISDSAEKLFRPDDELKRSEFCKMAVIISGQEKEAAQYKNSSVFPDVRASHWASGYIGIAARGEKKFIGGYPDGTFRPSEPISYGEALTILMRLLGYTDADSGAVWPQGYIDIAEKTGVSVKGLKGSDKITRAQAAALFTELLTAENKSGTVFYTELGTVSGSKTISSIDSGSGLVRFSDSSEAVLETPVAAQSLIGKTGTVIKDSSSGKMLLFIPDSITEKDAPSSAAVIVSKNGSAAGFDALSGGSSYTIYRNGVQVTESAIKKYDVATYSPSSHSIVLSDNSLSTYYADCTPNASAPTQITILGNTKLEVLSTAADSLASFKPGMTVTLLFTADGRVAGAVNSSSRSNMLAAVDEEGNINLICGSTLIPVNTGLETDSKYLGKIVSVHSYKKNDISFTVQKTSAALPLDIEKNTADGKTLADSVMIFEDGKLVSKADIKKTIAADKITYYRLNSNGQVSLVAYTDSGETKLVTGKASRQTGYEETLDGDCYEVDMLRLQYGEESYEEANTYEEIPEGKYAVASLKTKASGKSFSSIKQLERTGKVTKSSFIGTEAVNCSSLSYEIYEDAVFYNTDSKGWMESFDAAYTYGDEFTLYTYDGIVYLIEVSAAVK